MTFSHRKKSTFPPIGEQAKWSARIGRAEDNIEAIDQQIADMEQQIKEETDRITAKVDPMTEELETTTLKPKKTNVSVQLVSLVWVPHWLHQDGTLTTAWE